MRLEVDTTMTVPAGPNPILRPGAEDPENEPARAVDTPDLHAVLWLTPSLLGSS